MKILKYIILVLIVLNIPEVIVRNMGSVLGTISSYLVFLLLIIYYLFLKERGTLNKPVIIIGVFYYLISSFQCHWPLKEFTFISIKFFIVIIVGNELVKRTTAKDLFILFNIGALTIILHSLLFSNNYGRYSGFYFNPNSAGFIAIMAFALTFSLKKGLLKLGATLISSLGGLLTFSRTFIILWLLTNTISVKNNPKNLRILFYGLGVIMIIYTFKDELKVNTTRFDSFKAIIENDKSRANDLKKDSRTLTWSLHYNAIYKKPLFGNGFFYFQGGHVVAVGVHNSFLLILGEAGIIPFMVFVLYFIYLLINAFIYFKSAPYLLMMTIGLIAVLMADHGFFTFYVFPVTAMWIQHQINLKKTKMYKEQPNLTTQLT